MGLAPVRVIENRLVAGRRLDERGRVRDRRLEREVFKILPHLGEDLAVHVDVRPVQRGQREDDQLRVRLVDDLVDNRRQAAERLVGEPVRLDGDQDVSRRAEGVDGRDAEVRRAVDDDVIEIPL